MVDNLNDIEYTTEEKIMAEEMREKDTYIEGIRPVYPACIQDLQRVFSGQNSELNEESERYGHDPFQGFFIIAPHLEECQLFGDHGIFPRLTDDLLSPNPMESDQEMASPFLSGDGDCAWYKPHHIYGHDWGIVLRIQCIFALARTYCRDFDGAGLAPHEVSRLVHEFLILAAATLSAREFYRHKVESFGIRLREAQGTTGPCAYMNYQRSIRRNKHIHPADQLEDALAAASAYRYIRNMHNTKGFQRVATRSASDSLEKLFRHPQAHPGFSDGQHFLQAKAHKVAEWELMQRVQEGQIPPPHCGDHWRHTNGMMGALVNIGSVPHFTI
jgi:hypothetical protein